MIRILSIDDCAATRELLKLLIEKTASDMSVTQASGYREGMRALADQRFDVVLLDLIMPDAPMPHLLTQNVVDVARCPVIVVSGLTDDRDEIAHECLLAGATEYFSKDHINHVGTIDKDVELLTRVIRKVHCAEQGRKLAAERNGRT